MRCRAAIIMTTAETIIAALGLQPHPEGGHFRETFRSDERIGPAALPERYGADRAIATAIYYLIEQSDFSALHRVQSDEVFHFYLGSPVELFVISPEGIATTTILGANVTAGQRPQTVVPRGSLQGLRVVRGGDFALLGATVAPGFDFADFELVGREAAIRAHPAETDRIVLFTRG
jgi:predicted cupin superfamily sugar epimerase